MCVLISFYLSPFVVFFFKQNLWPAASKRPLIICIPIKDHKIGLGIKRGRPLCVEALEEKLAWAFDRLCHIRITINLCAPSGKSDFRNRQIFHFLFYCLSFLKKRTKHGLQSSFVYSLFKHQQHNFRTNKCENLNYPTSNCRFKLETLNRQDRESPTSTIRPGLSPFWSCFSSLIFDLFVEISFSFLFLLYYLSQGDQKY